jgi:Ca-activated chloride channel family protein
VDFGSGIHDVYPQRIPDLFAGGQVTILGRYRDAGDRRIVLKGRIGDREVAYDHEGTLKTGEGAPFLPRLWAHRKVAFLLDEIRLRGENKELVDEVIRLATRHGIVTPYTAGLVVEEAELEAGARFEGAVAGRTVDRLGLLAPEAAPSPAPAGPPGDSALPPGAASGGGGVHASLPAEEARREAESSRLLRELKDALTPDDKGKKGEDSKSAEARERVREVEGKTFLRDGDGRWVDTSWDGKATPVKVVAWSDAWLELSRKSDRLAKWLSLGEKVLVVVGEEVFEVVPE